MTTITPAVAGPYDLGTAVVRVALYVNAKTTQVHAVSDPIPQILEGVPLDVRSVSLKLDRSNFTLNPTSCNPMTLTGNATSPSGSSAALSSHFQVGGCSALPFKPKLSFSFKGGTKRGQNPALNAVLEAQPGEANIAKMAILLPRAFFVDPGHIKAICTRAQYSVGHCPPGSIYGKAKVITPMLDQPLSGPVYLRASSGSLPDLVVDLNGQIHLTMVGHIDPVKGQIQTSIETLPDIPVSKLTLSLRGGKKGLLINGKAICKAKDKLSVQMDGQNGSAFDTSPVLASGCRKAKSSSISSAKAGRVKIRAIDCGGDEEERKECAPGTPASTPAKGFFAADTPASVGACPNEQLRLGHPSASLPDCRAYEQATPTDKNGADASGYRFKIQASLAGDGITSQTISGLPGAEGAQQFPIFLSQRDPSGWSTQGFLPPPAYGENAAVLAWTPDLAYSFSSAGFADSGGGGAGLIDEALLLRSSATHAIQQVTPYIEGARYAFAGASADDSRLFFESRSPLTGNAASGDNLYVYEPASKALSLVGVLPTAQGGQAPPGGSFAGPFNWWNTGGAALSSGGALSAQEGEAGYLTQELHAISTNGSKAFFTAGETGQVYMREGIGGQQPETVQVSASQRSTPDANGTKPAIFMGATPSGSRAFIASCEKLTDDSTTYSNEEFNSDYDCRTFNQGQDLYAFDTATRQLSDLTVDNEDPRGAEVMGMVGASDDGSYVYFVANGDLDGAGGAERGNCRRNGRVLPYTGTCNLYLWHAGSSTLVARLEAEGDALNWMPGGGEELSTGRVSADGKVVVFRSQRQLTGYDTHAVGECAYKGGPVCPQFYRYQAGDGTLSCVTCNPSGVPPRGGPTVQSIEEPVAYAGGNNASHLLSYRFVSASGDRVFFESPDKLVSADTNGDGGCPRMRPTFLSLVPTCQDVYEWEAPGAGSCSEASSAYSSQDKGCLYLLSSGTSIYPAFFGDASPSGNDVFIFSRDQLVPDDEDQLLDIYDASVDGGLASQNQVRPVPCEGEACQGGDAGTPPGAPSPGSASFQGPGNPQATHRQPHPRHKPKHKHKRSSHGKRDRKH